MTAHTWW